MEDPEYEEKFQKLLTYVPFLNNMIRNLEAAAEGSSNPRQAQLDKIRALRALLTNKKRMRKENLQKCQQVLLNLRAKVEQKEMFADLKGLFGPDPAFAIDPPTPQEKSDLEAVRNKLKIVAKRPGDDKETLPEILRVNEVEDIHTAGSKEPALFQRRPNKSSLSPIHRTPTKIKDEKVSPQSASKRNYTRVLVSPDSSARRRWSTPDLDDNKPLFCRRSPRRSPRRYSPSYHKRERKKSSKESGRKSKDFNITLKVPEDRLSALNTKDIFSRIMHCKDSDVDIHTLRGLREQIITELKKTGARDDISELILKSYNKKKDKKNRIKQEVEEGELSDSESEVIENVYGSLSGNLVLKDQSETETSTDKDKAHKIQICLVINPDTKPNPNTSTSADNSDFLELEMYDKQSKEVNKTEKNESTVIKVDDDDDLKKVKLDMKNNDKEKSSIDKETSKKEALDLKLQQPPEEEKKGIIQKEPVKNTANFYKPMTDGSELEKIEDNKEAKYAQTGIERKKLETPNTSKNLCLIEAELEKMEKPVEIPLLNDPIITKPPTDSKLSEIDILQALKNEILSEVITIPGAETDTPLLHQPKLNKVASAKEIMPKKRISIENYKQKTDRDKMASSIKIILRDNPSKDDNTKKPSLKLTEKEYERFNIQKKMPFDDDSSDGDDGGEIEASDLYSDLAPKSPDRDESIDMELASPVIIPGDPVQAVPLNRNADVDMRTLPILSPNQIKPMLFGNITGLSSMESITAVKTDQIKIQNKSVLFDPRVRRDVNNSSQSPSPHTVNSDRTPRSAFSNISPTSNAVMTPNARSYEMTPNRQSYDFDPSNKKHVYVPSLTMSDSREREHSVVKDSKVHPTGERKPRWEDIGDTSSWSSSDVSINTRYTDSYTGEKYSKGKRNDRYSLDNRDSVTYKRSECPRTPLPSFGRSDVPMTPLHSYVRAECPTTPIHHFGRAECPTTPSHHFGRSECQPTSHSFGRLELPPNPSHSFGRSECPPTPSHSFGRSDGPSTPSHPFGRSDGPSTPIHPFGSHSFNINEHALSLSHQFSATECPPTPYYGRNECPPTPNHGFGRSDCPSTPNHPFGRSDFNAQKYAKDPRLNRKSEYESNSNLNERDRGYYKDSGYNRGSSYKSQKPFGGSENYASQDREQGRNKSSYYAPEQTGRQLNKDPSRREKPVSSITMDYERERPLSRERGQYNSGYDDVALRRGNQRERSIGRSEHTEDKRDRSVGRHVLAEDTYIRPSSRGPSVRGDSIDPVNKYLSVKPYAGRSFKIDTSVNETFQKFLENGKGCQVLDYNFDARRKRATSVGRALLKESRGEQVTDGSKQNSETIYKKEVFRRASSVGRDLTNSSLDGRSFQEIKADFKTYSHSEKESRKFDTDKIRNIDTKSKTSTEHIARNRREKEYYEKYKEEKHSQSSSKVAYSPRMNYRDPRMRKENKTKNKYEDPRARKSGIVYSNDNIVKGVILASGYGVKNYKIPKIKRVVEEKEVEIPKKEESVNKMEVKEKYKLKNIEKRTDKEGTTEEKAKIKEKTTVKEKISDKRTDKNEVTQKNKDLPKEKLNESPKHKIKEISKEKTKVSDTKSDSEVGKPLQIDEISEPDVQVGRRSTRLSTKLAVTSPVKDVDSKSKKSKKSIVSDTDSDTDNSVSEKVPKAAEKDLDITTHEPPPQVTSPIKEKIAPKQPNAADTHTNFGLELEMFPDNVASDHVLENINALIATLDNDNYESKNESSNNFTNEITLENMMQNITSPQENCSESRDEFANVLKAVGELSQTTDDKIQENSLSDLNKIHEDGNNFPHVNSEVSQERNISEDSRSNSNSTTQNLRFDNLLDSVKSFEAVTIQNNEVEKKKDEVLCSSNLPINEPTNDDIVSTSEMEKVTLPVEAKSKIDESLDGCSTPDSTINIEVLDKNKNDDCLADSTNGEVHSEMNVTSTGSVESKSILSSTKTESDLELGNLLTMLQDKSKIKKLLSMLGDQSGDNDKIKKKLEKLSEIVSDDEMEDKMEQPEIKPEVSVITDSKKPDANQTVVKEGLNQMTLDDEATKGMNVDEDTKKEIKVDEEVYKNTESQSHEDEQTKVKKDNEENKLKSDEETQLNKDEDQENDDDQDKDENFGDFIGEDATETEEMDLQVTKTKCKKKITGKKSKFSRKGKGRWAKKVSSVAEKRVTRATAAVETIKKPKKPPRELQKLHDDIKEMGLEDEILSATGIRMCRLAKMVDEKKEEVALPEPEAVVVLENIKASADKNRDNFIPEKVRKKPGPKPKLKISTESLPELEKPKYKPGPKSKTRNKKELDPYAFETESAEGTTTIEKANEDHSDNSSDSDNCSLASTKSFGSSELLADIFKNKKLKRKRGRGWQDGVIKPKNKKKKLEDNLESTLELPGFDLQTEKQDDVPDSNCFTDRNYCFRKNESRYTCRLCGFACKDIVRHYVNEHPHEEIPLSRMAPEVAKEVVVQCKGLNLNSISKIFAEKYICLFCFKEFTYTSTVMETFFWHIVSQHTGECKRTCSECPNETRCPYSLDIPPPPDQTKGQLIGFLCKRCNFTQLSLENLKQHVVRRHNDEQTAVHKITLSAITKKTMKKFSECKVLEPPARQGSSPPEIPVKPNNLPDIPVKPSNLPEILAKPMNPPDMPAKPSSPLEVPAKPSEDPSDVAESTQSEAQLRKPAIRGQLASIKSMITFEGDDNVNELSDLTSKEPIETQIKQERIESESTGEVLQDEPHPVDTSEITQAAEVDQPVQLSHQEDKQSSLHSGLKDPASQPSNDIVDYPHFKINISESGAKEYICCINGKDNHFKTTLLISMKKHVQLKHSENWDGYCFVCKVIVTPQGAHKFKGCLQHYLDKHMDNFPIYQQEVLSESALKEVPDKPVRQTDSPAPSKPIINVRPINELISTAPDNMPREIPSFPVIKNVVSLGAESPRLNPTYPTIGQEIRPTEVRYKYEEVQAKVMLNKHRVVLETMMARDKLIQVFKCAGRFCSFTSDSAEDALLHASTHQRIGGADALNCSYCDFDAVGNAIDLVMHVFNAHAHCQYSCSQCFYRAAASQSVAAHTARAHGVELSEAIALRTTVATAAGDGGRVLTREEAVPYYDCYHAENGSLCKFRNYTHDKFIDHLQQKHTGTTSHPCYICQKGESSPSELVLHMKTHGLQLYQCTWCVCGADSDLEMLGHVSSEHPTKQPQAYLRIITNKEGSTELRVLPLAFLNKMKVATEDVSPSAAKENPVREAERSIDLEKLIGGLTFMMEVEPQQELSEPTPEAHTQAIAGAVHEQVAPIAPAVAVAELKTGGPFAEVLNAVASISAPMQIDVTTQPPAHSSTATITTDLPLSIGEVPVKAEITETSISLPREVVVLDSDDEDSSDPVLPVIDLSDEETTPNNKEPMQKKNKRVPNDLLATCPKCRQICKSINGLKKHFFYCYPNKDEGCKCAHCPYLASSRVNLLHHYVDDHCDKNVYQCGICRTNQENLSAVKRHLRNVHKEKDYIVTSVVENGVSWYIVNAAKKDREKKELPKRKLSSNASDTLKRRYWPQEIHLLPINPILDQLVYCEICEFSTKVRVNMVRHLQLHAEQQPVAQTAPVNPVPHLETNEKHFDRMVNLASSSLVVRTPAPAPSAAPAGAVFVAAPRELAAAYPRHVAARARHTCGALGCAYTSVDECMLRRHWEALHAGSFNFRCVHCPNTQTLDTSKPITAQRVVYHLKMHDDTLYACSKCHFYHWKRDVMEKHIVDLHPGIQVHIYIVRENASAAAAAAAAAAASTATASPSAAPTMDLKPWQCGFCKFKSMLRPEVVEHSFKVHQSKMQFRCGYCPYRASVIENVNNHLAHSHANEPAEVIHYYYREGDLPDNADGAPRWVRQRQVMGSNMPEVKTEVAAEPVDQAPVVTPPPVNIDLNLVKREVVDAAALETLESMEDLCKRYGQFCEPNGLKFKCPLCNVISEDTREAMQSHLYEELQYRKWGCGLCNYKAFHKAGLTEHMNIEHFRQYDHIELPKDMSKEKWVAGQLDHQAAIIDKYKANFAKQKIVNERVTKPAKVATPPPVEAVKEFSVADLENTFGLFGAPSNAMYCCPKCGAKLKDEAAMRDHLELELSSIRWGCSNCSDGYAHFHEAQFHCKGHDGPSRPVPREPALRAAWIAHVIEVQKKILQTVSTPANSEPPSPEKSFSDTDNNSLLVVRYDPQLPGSRKRAAPESDDERLVIDEGGARSRQWVPRPCPHCNYRAKYYNSWKEHVLKHYNLKPFMCKFCDYGCSHKQALQNHTKKNHSGLEPNLKMTPIPLCHPESYVPSAESMYTRSPKRKLMVEDEANVPKVICLFCETSIPETDVDIHLHENIRPDFARKGDVVVKCCICLVLRLDVKSLQDHHNLAHPHVPVNYALFKLRYDTRETHFCGHCDDIGFKFLRDLKTHHNAVHPTLLFKYTTVPYYASADKESRKKEEPPSKRCAKKSTTKLPGGNTVAKKSTTKLPYSVPDASDDGFSCYKTKPEPLDNYPNVTAIMSFCNRMMPFPLKKLSEIINIKPTVILKDIRAGPSSDMTLQK